jgi:hypothetical protein
MPAVTQSVIIISANASRPLATLHWLERRKASPPNCSPWILKSEAGDAVAEAPTNPGRPARSWLTGCGLGEANACLLYASASLSDTMYDSGQDGATAALRRRICLLSMEECRMTSGECWESLHCSFTLSSVSPSNRHERPSAINRAVAIASVPLATDWSRHI